ncbi:MAG: hypothetical protein JWN85_553 [Gammaproteobacteria bacterium]|nr:hypothetical protein [Gammaproteobacteria bacterium]
MIFVGLVFAAIGLWVTFGFIRYKRYFERVRRLLVAAGSENIWHLPAVHLSEVDDTVRRSYFARESLSIAATEAGDVMSRLRS